MEKEVIVIGGGIIGVCSALYLSEQGHRVTLIDRGDLNHGCSFGNAGMIVPSHVIPLAAPGMISQGMKWMLDAKSPFYVKPRISKELLSWGLKFRKAASQEHVDKSTVRLRDLSLLSKTLYRELAKECADFHYDEKGLLMLFQTEGQAEEEIKAGELAKSLGLEVDFLSKAEVDGLETGTSVNAIGGVYYKSDAHLHPSKLMAYLIQRLVRKGVTIFQRTEVQEVVKVNGAVTGVRTSSGLIAGDEFVFAGGAWSPQLTKQLNIRLPLLPGKGYSFTLSGRLERPKIPSILCEGKVAVTPMGTDLRFGGTMEITHVQDNAINRRRVEGIVTTIQSFYPSLSIEMPRSEDTWYGFRPCSPDGMPYIGRLSGLSNVIVATGHAMMGLSLGPATGFLVNELVSGRQINLDMAGFHPERYC